MESSGIASLRREREKYLEREGEREREETISAVKEAEGKAEPLSA